MRLVCRLHGISASGYYKRLKHMASSEEYELRVVSAIGTIRQRQPRVGGRKLQMMLSRQGVEIGRDRLYRLLDRHDLLSTLYRRKRLHLSRGPYQSNVPNLLRDIPSDGSVSAIVTDITYIQTRQGMRYLCVYLDYHSRKVLSWRLSDTLHRSVSIKALRSAMKEIGDTRDVIHHSDHGGQYSSRDYTKVLRHGGMRISMTGEYRCYDNAVVERFHNTLKHEFGLANIQTSEEIARKAIADSIRIYNNERLHASLEYQTPNQVFQHVA